MSLYLGTQKIAVNSSSREIGEIIQSTIPLSDAGLHLLDGALISGAGSYAKFVNYIAGLVSSYPNLFETEANWQSAVTTYGVCGKFVYDSVNNTVRLPKYSNKIYTGGGTAPVVGNGMTLGLTDGTNYFGISGWDGNSGDISKDPDHYGTNLPFTRTGGNKSNKGLGVTTDSSKSGIIAQLSDITTSLDSYYYIVIASSVKTNIEVDIDEIATDLNGKADVDLSNMNPTQTVKNTIIDWSMLDYSAVIDVTSSLYANKYYTAPKRGVLFNSMIPNQNSPIKINGYTIGIRRYSTYGNWIPTPYPMQNGDTFSVTGWIGNEGGAYFVPLKGAN